jgi:hypothetical protein
MSNDYSFVITKKKGDVVDVYVYPLVGDMVNKLNIGVDAKFTHYTVTNKDVDTKSKETYGKIKSNSDDVLYEQFPNDTSQDSKKSDNDTKSFVTAPQSKDLTTSIVSNIPSKYNFGGKERKRKGKTHKKVKKGGMKTIKIWR